MAEVLVLCTGNSCRSIMAEALINADLKTLGVNGHSSGVRPLGVVNRNALAILRKHGIPTDGLHSKTLDMVLDRDYDLVVTVCDPAREHCPVFPKKTKIIHVGFVDPEGQGPEGFEDCFQGIRSKLLPRVKEELGL